MMVKIIWQTHEEIYPPPSSPHAPNKKNDKIKNGTTALRHSWFSSSLKIVVFSWWKWQVAQNSPAGTWQISSHVASYERIQWNETLQSLNNPLEGAVKQELWCLSFIYNFIVQTNKVGVFWRSSQPYLFPQSCLDVESEKTAKQAQGLWNAWMFQKVDDIPQKNRSQRTSVQSC